MRLINYQLSLSDTTRSSCRLKNYHHSENELWWFMRDLSAMQPILITVFKVDSAGKNERYSFLLSRHLSHNQLQQTCG